MWLRGERNLSMLMIMLCPRGHAERNKKRGDWSTKKAVGVWLSV